jgi:hypothetical protein
VAERMEIESATGTPLRVVYLPDGMSESRPSANRFVDSNESRIEFYDRRYGHTPDGQFICDYYVATITEDERDRGLRLWGDSPDWTVNAEWMATVREWLLSCDEKRDMNRLKGTRRGV